MHVGHDKRNAAFPSGSGSRIKSRFILFSLIRGFCSLELSSINPTTTLGSIPTPEAIIRRQSSTIPLVITNNCSEVVYPGINTQINPGPETNGFRLNPGESRELHVPHNWQGRVWGRTNCSFTGDEGPRNSNQACESGDCAGAENCRVGGLPPVTLAEFTCGGQYGQSYYDISLVDGFNIGMAIVLLSDRLSNIAALPPNRTNPSCVGSVSHFVDNFQPYEPQGQVFLGTNSSYPLKLVGVSRDQVSRWCPWDLQVNPPKKPDDGVYPYPDDDIERPVFNPCWSACAKYNNPSDCCTGDYNSPQRCQANKYARQAKMVCPDAYSYAYDDHDSTIVVPAGAGFEVVFCPAGPSTTILTYASPKVASRQHTLFRRDLSLSRLQARAAEKVKSSAANIEIRHPALAIMAVALMLVASIFVTL